MLGWGGYSYGLQVSLAVLSHRDFARTLGLLVLDLDVVVVSCLRVSQQLAEVSELDALTVLEVQHRLSQRHFREVRLNGLKDICHQLFVINRDLLPCVE